MRAGGIAEERPMGGRIIALEKAVLELTERSKLLEKIGKDEV
jgi:hypothetical protein